MNELFSAGSNIEASAYTSELSDVGSNMKATEDINELSDTDVCSNSKGPDDISEFSDIDNDENLFDPDNHDSLEINVHKSRHDCDSEAFQNEAAADKVEATDNDSDSPHDQHGRDILKESGISSDVVNSMCRAYFPKSGVIEKKFDWQTFHVPFTQSSFDCLPVIDKTDYRQFGGQWISFMRSLLEKVNKFCIWTFKKNIKTAGSRKTNQGHFLGERLFVGKVSVLV